jgi:hypothetical protein
MYSDQQNQGKIVGLGTSTKFGVSMSDMEDLFPVKLSRTEIILILSLALMMIKLLI